MKLSYPEYRLRKDKNRLLFFLGGLFGVIVLSSYYSVVHLNTIRIPNITVLVIVLTFASMFSILISRISDFLDEKIEKILVDAERSKLGVDGEKLAKQAILSSVDVEDRVFFNKNLPTGGDIDCLILGKKGLLLIEVKNNAKRITLLPFWVPGFYDPRDEAKKHVRKLREYIQTGYSKDLYIRPCIFHINSDVVLRGKQGVFSIVGVDRFAPYFNQLSADTSLSEKDIDRLAVLIDQLK